MAKAKKTCFGFGVEPSETQNHFYVVIFNRQEKKTYVEIYERYKWRTIKARYEHIQELWIGLQFMIITETRLIVA